MPLRSAPILALAASLAVALALMAACNPPDEPSLALLPTALAAPPDEPTPTDAPTPTDEPTPTNEPTPAAERPPLIVFDGGGAPPTAHVGGAAFEVEIAFTTDARTRGLSGRDGLPDGAGMLFVFDGGVASKFWMREMRFALDFVWIGDNCEVVDIHANVPPPPPDTPLGELPLYESETPARYNLEITAGEAAKRGIAIGDAVKFSGFSGEGATCR